MRPWLAILAVGLLTGGCPFGDCFPRAKMTVTIAPDVDVSSGVTLCLSSAVKFYPGDITGSDSQGLPVGPKARNFYCTNTTTVAGQRTYVVDASQDPYPSWYWAWIDTNNNGQLDAGERFGTDAHNPVTQDGCDSYRGSITIDRAYAP